VLQLEQERDVLPDDVQVVSDDVAATQTMETA
jgi:hypothetical protein